MLVLVINMADTNGVAKGFWNEVFDLASPAEDTREIRRQQGRRKKERRMLVRRTVRPA